MNKKNIIWHVVAWSIYMGMAALRKYFGNTGYINFIDILLTYIPGVYIFYGNAEIFTRFLKKNPFVFFFIEILFLASYYVLAYIIGFIVTPAIIAEERGSVFDLRQHLIVGLWVFLNYTFLSFGYYFARKMIEKQKQLNITNQENRDKAEQNLLLQKQNIELEQHLLKKEQQRLQSEYAFLRSQINPHFLQNTLNYLYAQALTGQTREMSEAILLLSDIMRYSLDNQDDGQYKVSLANETRHLDNFIRINQLRFNNKLQIVFEKSGDTDSIKIIPLVLITLVENAFKHGDLNDQQYPMQINLHIETGERPYLQFSVYNKKSKGPKQPSHGIGIGNIRRRLDTTYGEDYSLDNIDEQDHYKAALTIRLKPARDMDSKEQNITGTTEPLPFT